MARQSRSQYGIDAPLSYVQIPVSDAPVGLNIGDDEDDDVRAAIIAVSGGDVRWRADGEDPAASEGIPMLNGVRYIVRGHTTLSRIKFIRAGDSDVILDIHYYERIDMAAFTAALGDGGGIVHISDGVSELIITNLDFDTSAGKRNVSCFGLALPSSTGPVIGGTDANPIKTDGIPLTPIIYNVDMPNANEEKDQQLPDGCREFVVKLRSRTDELKVRYTSGGPHMTVHPGGGYGESGKDLSGITIYVESPASNQVAEVIAWSIT